MKKRSLFSKSTFIIIFALLLLYFGHQLFMILNNPLKTVNALYITVDDAIPADGYFVRDEQVIEGDSGTVQFTVNPGEKIAKGAEIAEVFNDEKAASLKRQIADLDEQIKSIENARDQSIDKANAGKIDNLITMQVQDLSQTMENGMVGQAYDQVKDLKSLVIERTMAEQGGVFDESALSELKVKSDELKQQLDGRMKSIRTNLSGYFSRTVDGYESILTPDKLDEMTVKSVKNLSSVTKEANNTNALGKVMGGFSWYFASVVDEKSADTLKVGRVISLRFSQGPSYDVPAVVYNIKKDNQGKALIMFKSDTIDDELVSMRHQQVDIIKRTYKGIKVPKEAIRIEDGKEGVFVVFGTQAVFKKVDIMFETESFYIVRADGTDEKNLFIYDKIIVNAKGLEDKKVIK